MSDQKIIDFAEMFEGLGFTPDELSEFLHTHVSKENAQKFLAGKRGANLKERYDAEVKALDLSHLDGPARARKLSAVKAKFRNMGLEVW